MKYFDYHRLKKPDHRQGAQQHKTLKVLEALQFMENQNEISICQSKLGQGLGDKASGSWTNKRQHFDPETEMTLATIQKVQAIQDAESLIMERTKQMK